MNHRKIYYAFLVTVITLMSGACISQSDITTEESLRVITTNTILADFARVIGGDLVAVETIMPLGSDVHSFQPTPNSSLDISKARVIISNGHGLDTFLEPLIESAMNPTSIRLVASYGLGNGTTSANIGHSLSHEENHLDHVDRSVDPHFWLNPEYAIHYVERIRDTLILIDSSNEEIYRANTEKYVRKLENLDIFIQDTLREIPVHRRQLVTLHNGFQHFASKYDFSVSYFVSHDPNSGTPAEISETFNEIGNGNATTIFTSPGMNSGILTQLATDLDMTIQPIYSDTLTDDVDTYLEMMEFNARSLERSLKQDVVKHK